MGLKMDKERLLATIEKQRSLLDKTLSRVNNSQMLEPNFESGWSVKDILAHIAFWDEHALVNIIAAHTNSDRPSLGRTIDEINTTTFETRRNLSLEEVQSSYRTAYEKMLAGVAKLTEEDITDPTRFPWTKRSPLRRLIRQDTDLHYAEHNRQITSWLERSGTKV